MTEPLAKRLRTATVVLCAAIWASGYAGASLELVSWERSFAVGTAGCALLILTTWLLTRE
ncbi:hypothetical protein ACQP2P_13860 [Dactylosporangium sp. CA-139114]|uniref:hypothetical protein n=1 Tax=Dactylosporangium sp. CA-139114 TaxID=3239931 RepID=UPI003D95C5FD